MLSLPVMRDVDVPVWMIISAMAYFTILFFVLKMFNYNRDRFNE